MFSGGEANRIFFQIDLWFIYAHTTHMMIIILTKLLVFFGELVDDNELIYAQKFM